MLCPLLCTYSTSNTKTHTHMHANNVHVVGVHLSPLSELSKCWLQLDCLTPAVKTDLLPHSLPPPTHTHLLTVGRWVKWDVKRPSASVSLCLLFCLVHSLSISPVYFLSFSSYCLPILKAAKSSLSVQTPFVFVAASLLHMHIDTHACAHTHRHTLDRNNTMSNCTSYDLFVCSLSVLDICMQKGGTVFPLQYFIYK